jgi:transketolase
MALVAKADGNARRIYCVLSDGECNEGSTWEAVLFAPHHKLDNLVTIVDFNQIQSFGRVSDVLGLQPFADKWRAFGWHAIELDGHDIGALTAHLSPSRQVAGRPTVVIARTVKGKGVSFMEDKLEWHYKSPDDRQLALACAEVGA